MNISFRKLRDCNDDFMLLHKWCQNKYIYEWFEQRKLSFDEIVVKYRNKLNGGKQELFIIQSDGKDIGYTQMYKFEYDHDIKNIESYNNIYEFDLFIGEEEYLSKGIGAIIIKNISNMIYSKYNADSIMLRSFKRNIRAIKCYQKCNYKIVDEYLGKDSLNNPETILVLINEKNTNN